MSVYSTIKITRDRARTKALEYVLTADDEVLSEIMNKILDNRFYNCTIVNDADENENELL